MPVSKQTQEKIDALKARAKHLAEKVGRGAKGTALAAGTGVGAYYANKAIDAKVEDSTARRWGKPLALIIGGHMVKRRQYDIGTGAVAIGGFLLGEAIDKTMAESADKSSTTSTTTTTTSVPAAGDLDAGAYNADAMGWTVTSGDAGGGVPISAPPGGAGISSAPTGRERMLTGGRMPMNLNVQEASALYD